MNITRENIDSLNAVLKVRIEKPDYEEKVESVLRDYRKKANIKGFRPGMVPIGLVKKMYGKAAKVEEINKLISESIQKYLTDEKVEILGDPLPLINDTEIIDFDLQETFDFSFELGLTPSFELGISNKNKVIYNEIAIDEKMKNDYITNYTRRFGEFRIEEIVEEKDILKGKIKSVETGEETEGEVSLAVDIIKDEAIKQEFIGKTPQSTITFNLRSAYPNDNEIAGLLKIKKEEAEVINGDYQYTISEITRYHNAELNQELYNKVYGEGVVNSMEEFMSKVETEISASLARESEYKLLQDIKKSAIESTVMEFPEPFLKKWLLRVNENTTAEQIEKEFDLFKKDLKWQLIRNSVAKENNLKITEEDLQKEAENITRYQFQQYGLYYATDEQIAKYASETLKRDEDARRIADKIIEDRVLVLLKEKVNIEKKSTTAEEFNKLFEEK